MPLSNKGQSILQLLVDCINNGRFTPDNPETFLGYKEVHDLLKLPKVGPHWGASLNYHGMAELAPWLKSEGHPAITGLVINQQNHTPGDGYFAVNGRIPGDRTWWENEIRSAIIYDWSPFVTDNPLPSHPELVAFTQAIAEGKMTTIDVAIRERCEQLRKRARQFYSRNGTLSCEICGWSKPDNRFRGDIVELHHIRPLHELSADGVTMTLKDAIASLAPLCPNCHRCAHSRKDDRRTTFSMEELRAMIPMRHSETQAAKA